VHEDDADNKENGDAPEARDCFEDEVETEKLPVIDEHEDALLSAGVLKGRDGVLSATTGMLEEL